MPNLKISERLEYTACNVCGADDYQVLYAASLSEGDFAESHLQYRITRKGSHCGQIVRCKQCKLVYVNPRERPSDIIDHYASVVDYEYLSEQKARSATFFRGLQLVEKHCPDKGALLDIGCFTGLFLAFAKRSGWSVSGIEPSRWAAAHAREVSGLSVEEGSFEDHDYQENFFDCVTLWDVIEHVSDPKAVLSKVYRILKTDGIAVINTLNFNSVFRKLLGRRYWFIERMHIYYFCPDTISALLEACRFEILSIFPHFKTLSYGYYLSRLREENRLCAHAFSLLRIHKLLPVTLYAGQMTILARKREG